MRQHHAPGRSGSAGGVDQAGQGGRRDLVRFRRDVIRRALILDQLRPWDDPRREAVAGAVMRRGGSSATAARVACCVAWCRVTAVAPWAVDRHQKIKAGRLLRRLCQPVRQNAGRNDRRSSP